MGGYLATEEQIGDWLYSLSERRELFWPRPAGRQNFSFLPVATRAEISFGGYLPTIVPPARRLLPDDETLFVSQQGDDLVTQYLPGEPPAPMILAGVRPCDLKGIAQLDAVMADAPADSLYLARRAATVIIGMNCLAPCDERCFCASTEALDFKAGADIFLTLVNDGFLVEPLSEAGEELLVGSSFAACEDGEARRLSAEESRPVPFGRELAAAVAALPEILRTAYSSKVYQRHGERCFSCGTCNLVCPTCYCFEVKDDMALDGVNGRRSRTWDSCMIPQFAEVAGEHNFRTKVGERQRHRLKRKFEYLPERFALGSFCVGCGRCGRQCTADIDIYEMINEIVEETGGRA